MRVCREGERAEMRKPVLLLCCAALFALTSCAGAPVGSQNSGRHSPPVVSGIPEAYLRLNPVGREVCLREGTSKDGRVVVAAKDIAGFYAENLKQDHTEMLVLQMTAQGQKSLSEATERLSKSEGKMSLWSGNTKIKSAGVYEPITGAKVAFDETDGDTQAEKDCILLSGDDPKTVLPGK